MNSNVQYLDLAIRAFNNTFIAGSFISIFIIILTQIVFKGKVNTKTAVEIFRWIIIAYAFLIVIGWLSEFAVGYFSGVEYVQFKIRSHIGGIYSSVLWFLWAINMILPFLLLIKKLGRNVYFLLLVALLMNAGLLFTSIDLASHRDYVRSSIPFNLFPYEVSAIISGLLWGVVAVLIGHFIDKLKRRGSITATY